MLLKKEGNLLIVDDSAYVFDGVFTHQVIDIDANFNIMSNGFIFLYSITPESKERVLGFIRDHTNLTVYDDDKSSLRIDMCTNRKDMINSLSVALNGKKTKDGSQREILKSGYYVGDKRIHAIAFDVNIWKEKAARVKILEIGLKKQYQGKGVKRNKKAYLWTQKSLQTFHKQSINEVHLGEGIYLYLGKPKD